jgi:hypothetical protein
MPELNFQQGRRHTGISDGVAVSAMELEAEPIACRGPHRRVCSESTIPRADDGSPQQYSEGCSSRQLVFSSVEILGKRWIKRNVLGRFQLNPAQTLAGLRQ